MAYNVQQLVFERMIAACSSAGNGRFPSPMPITTHIRGALQCCFTKFLSEKYQPSEFFITLSHVISAAQLCDAHYRNRNVEITSETAGESFIAKQRKRQHNHTFIGETIVIETAVVKYTFEMDYNSISETGCSPVCRFPQRTNGSSNTRQNVEKRIGGITRCNRTCTIQHKPRQRTDKHGFRALLPALYQGPTPTNTKSSRPNHEETTRRSRREAGGGCFNILTPSRGKLSKSNVSRAGSGGEHRSQKKMGRRPTTRR